ncbi:ribonuclease E [Rhodobacterales bacterium HTCC2654]|uniref:Ribonuclease E n=1 Tax=Maritimibacter alkaliphilus HTCC2654 TaxID=314271 RepID=A3VH41_9RHOB|nr:ribonuclease E [Rhodobacterales bacterium HTCC2654] [Maritimibacter alkaliphilus HTCC2654]
MLGLDPQIVHRAHGLQRAEHAQNPVVFPARRLGVEVAAHVDGKRIGVGPFAGREHVAHGVHPHAHARILAPLLEQGAPFGIGVGQGLTVVAARHAGADLGHFHQAVPKPVGVDTKVLTGGCHGTLLSFRRSRGRTPIHQARRRQIVQQGNGRTRSGAL